MATRIEASELAVLIDQYSGPLVLFATQLSDAPEDCVQEAFIQLAKLPEKPEAIASWLYKVVRNRSLNYLRSNQRRKQREQASNQFLAQSIDPSLELEVAEETRLMLQALDGLSADKRELIVLRIWSGLNWNEIADVVGCSSSAAQRRYVAALNLIRNKLESKCVTKRK